MLAIALAALLSIALPNPAEARTAAMKIRPVMAKAVDIPPPSTLPHSTVAGISVRLRCMARTNGVVGGCRVLEETRPGLGFGAAAVALMNGTPADPAWRTGDATFDHTIEFTP